MRIRQPARPSLVRRHLAVALLLSLAALLAACGSSSSSAVPASAAAASAPAATAASGGSGGSSGSAGGGGGAAGCASAKPAAEDVGIQMQLLYQVTSADGWTSMTDPSSPVPLDAVRFAKAVAVIDGQPGGAVVAAKYQPIADLMSQAASTTDPWGNGSGPAAQAHEKASAGFIDLGVALSTWLEGLGCTP